MGTNELTRIARRPRLSEKVSIALEGRIARGELKPGEQLPAEKILAETFGVSRAVVREAVAHFGADGRVETWQEAGAVVAPVSKCLNLRFWQGGRPAATELCEIFELRAMIESSIAELAARRRMPADIVAMRRHLSAMDDALASGGDGSAADDDFHLAIAAVTHNSHTCHLLEFMGRHFSNTRRLVWTLPGRVVDALAAAQAEHRATFEAIAAGDAAAGASARTRSLALCGVAGGDRTGPRSPVRTGRGCRRNATAAGQRVGRCHQLTEDGA